MVGRVSKMEKIPSPQGSFIAASKIGECITDCCHLLRLCLLELGLILLQKNNEMEKKSRDQFLLYPTRRYLIKMEYPLSDAIYGPSFSPRQTLKDLMACKTFPKEVINTLNSIPNDLGYKPNLIQQNEGPNLPIMSCTAPKCDPFEASIARNNGIKNMATISVTKLKALETSSRTKEYIPQSINTWNWA